MQGAIEDFSQELALVIRRFLKLKGWRDTERIVVGGGFRASRVGELAIGRASVILKADKVAIDLVPIRHDPDEAGLIGAAHLAPRWMFEAHDAILAVDIGGTNIRAGVVALHLKKARDLSKAAVWKFELWRHGDEKKAQARRRGPGTDRHARGPDRASRQGRACGSRRSSASAVPASSRRTAPSIAARRTCRAIGRAAGSTCRSPCTRRSPRSGSTTTAILLHNDAVVQGLSETPFMTDVKRWGVLTIGTGLGNARFTNRTASGKD